MNKIQLYFNIVQTTEEKDGCKHISVLFVPDKNPCKSPFLSAAELCIYIYVNKRIVLNFYFYIFSSIIFYCIPYLVSLLNLDSI